MSGERRQDARDRSFARILVRVEGRAGYVADVSENGFRAIFAGDFSPALDSPLRVEISFEELGLGIFPLPALARWSKAVEGGAEAGFELAPEAREGPEAGLFERLRSYYDKSLR